MAHLTEVDIALLASGSTAAYVNREMTCGAGCKRMHELEWLRTQDTPCLVFQGGDRACGLVYTFQSLGRRKPYLLTRVSGITSAGMLDVYFNRGDDLGGRDDDPIKAWGAIRAGCPPSLVWTHDMAECMDDFGDVVRHYVPGVADWQTDFYCDLFGIVHNHLVH